MHTLWTVITASVLFTLLKQVSIGVIVQILLTPVTSQADEVPCAECQRAGRDRFFTQVFDRYTELACTRIGALY